MKNLSNRQADLLNYLADLNDEFDARDYSAYRENGEAIRLADIRFMHRVGAAIEANTAIWSTSEVRA